MMKRTLLVLFFLVLLFTSTGCDTKKENQTNNQQQEQEQEENGKNNQQSNSNNNTYIDDEDNKLSSEDRRITVEKVINCEGCVYAYFSEEGEKAKKLGDTLLENEYTTDINNIRTMGNKQRHNFFGLVLSGNTILKAYSCILKDNKIYCIQGSTDGAYHTNNIGVLNELFTADQCKTLSDGHNYWCTDGHYNGNSKTSGYTALHYETSCTIYGADSNTGKLICH